MSLCDWTPAEVASFMAKAGFQDASVRMLDDEIDGEALALCKASDFQHYGIKRGPALKLVQRIQLIGGEIMATNHTPPPEPSRVVSPFVTALSDTLAPGPEVTTDTKATGHGDNGSVFRISDLQGRGKGIVAERKLGAGEEVFKETALLSVKTVVILSGVIIWRRSKVEQAYDALGAEAKQCYRSLHPMCEGTDTNSVDRARHTSDLSTCLRHRAGKGSNETNAESVACEQLDIKPPTAQQHRQIWDMNGFHFCDDADVHANRILHLACVPLLLSLVVGGTYAYCFQGSYFRSILAACVLFFAILGPISARVFYLGTQALFLQAARLNHNCSPNAVWRIDRQRAPLGGTPGGIALAERDNGASSPAAPIAISLATRQVVAHGEELTIDYIPELAHADPSVRCNLLQQEYGFSCSCARCAASKRKLLAGDEAEEEEY